MTSAIPGAAVLDALSGIIETRKTSQRSAAPFAGNPSYVARLLAQGQDAILKKIGEEATELVMASKDQIAQKIIAETADVWFHSLILLSFHGLTHHAVLDELARRFGISGLEEKARRTSQGGGPVDSPQPFPPESLA